jgi:hypothetical protein
MINKGHKLNFETLKDATRAERVALVECKDKKTGEIVFVVCAVNREEDGTFSFVPLAKLFNGSPYDELCPPNPDGGFHEEEDMEKEDMSCSN